MTFLDGITEIPQQHQMARKTRFQLPHERLQSEAVVMKGWQTVPHCGTTECNHWLMSALC